MQRRELETAAANYSYLRGLFYLPLGGLFVLSALGNWQVGPFRHAWVFLLVVLAIAAVAAAINRYYNERYGRLTPSTAQQVRAGIGLVLAAALMLGGATLLRSHASWSLDLPVNAIAVCFALVMLVTYAIGIGLKTYHVVIWGTVLVAGALPVWDGPDPEQHRPPARGRGRHAHRRLRPPPLRADLRAAPRHRLRERRCRSSLRSWSSTASSTSPGAWRS